MWERGAKDKMAIDLDRCISDHLGLPWDPPGPSAPSSTWSHEVTQSHVPLYPPEAQGWCSRV